MSHQIILCIVHLLIWCTAIFLLIAIVSLIKSKLNIFVIIFIFYSYYISVKKKNRTGAQNSRFLSKIPDFFLLFSPKFQIDIFLPFSPIVKSNRTGALFFLPFTAGSYRPKYFHQNQIVKLKPNMKGS